MKKFLTFCLLLLFLFIAPMASEAWQGRMAGMGDPYGLLEDESDLLIHPGKLAAGKGVRFYGNYCFNYTDIIDWTYNLDEFDALGQKLPNYGSSHSAVAAYDVMIF